MILHNLYRETYIINDRPCTVVADFAANTINIHTRSFSKQFSLNEYEAFEGDMKMFASSKINDPII